MSKTSTPLSGHVERFFVHQKVTPMINRFQILAPDPSGKPGDLMAFVEQKRLKMKEEIYFFTDETKETPAFSMKSRQVIDASARTDIFDTDGTEIAWFEKKFAKSLARSTWALHYGDTATVGTERSLAKALIRRVAELPLRFHFDFTDNATGRTVLSVERQLSLTDRYEVTVHDPNLDVRVAAGMTVALDVFQGR